MAILWMDGFDHYGTGLIASSLTGYGVYAAASSTYAKTTPTPRTGTYCLQLGTLRRVFGATKTSVGVGFAFYMDELPNADDDVGLMVFRNAGASVQCRLTINPTGTVALYTSTSTKQAESGIVIAPGQWYHIEAYFVPNGSSSSMEVRLNETTLFTKSPFTITGTPSNETSIVSFDLGVTVTYWYIDDLYAWDTSGSYNNNFIGDKRIATLYPDGDTVEADWTPNSGGTGYTQIDETTPDNDTTYITSSTVGDISEFNFQAMPTGAVGISALQVITNARKTDAGTADMRTDIVSNVSSTSGVTKTLTTAYGMRNDIFETDPNTGALWTKAGLDAAKIRIERVA